MKSNYKRIGDYIQLVDERNFGLHVKKLLGLSISKKFIPSVANIIGTDMENYKIIRRNQFACSVMQVRRDKKMPVALLKDVDEAIISQAYPVFEIEDTNELDPEYLMMWFTRSEFDREACFYAVGGVRGSLEWDDFENMQLPIPHITKQREIVKEYNTIQNRIDLNQKLIQKLEETAQAIYKQWFVDGIDFENLPDGWELKPVYETAGFINGAAFSESDFEVSRTGLPVIRIAELKNGVDCQTDFTKKQLQKKNRIKNGDMLYSWSGNPETSLEVFKWFGGEAYLNQHIFKLEFNSEQSNIFVYYMLKNLKRNFTRLAEGKQTTGLGHVTIEDLKELSISYPSENDLAKFENISKPIYNHDSILIQENQRLSKLKELLLSKIALVEG